jgi:nitrogen-specific signal transduction histidine kinase/CheY-like chemotaxis protein
VRDATGRLANYVGVFRNVTRERQIEEQFRQAQKMEAVGRLAGGVAHDFNNLLTIISGRCQLLLHRLGRDNPHSHELDLVLKTSHRAAALTRQLLAFSRKQVLSMQVLSLNTVVASIEKMLRPLIGEDIELVTILDPALGCVKADPGQIEQVIVNLAVNSRDAMPRGGRLTIETANVGPTSGLPAGAAPGPHVMLAVSDSGAGMDPGTLSHIFEPFFTTKGVERGTGLGLSTVYGIVKQSGGEISVESEPGRGTQFRIYLPRVEERVEPAALATLGAGRRRGMETILLVEDEPEVRRLIREFLEADGYTVLEAADGIDALRIVAEHTGPVPLIITDVVMPQIDGRNLVQRLRALRPDIRALYMSGYTDDAILRYGVLTAEAAFLHKPFATEALLRQVRVLLDGGSPGDRAAAGILPQAVPRGAR